MNGETHMLGRCPSCGESRRRGRTRHWKSLPLHRCAGCDLVYSDPQPRQLVDARYETQYDLADYFAAKETRKRVLFERRLNRLGRPVRGADLLCDVGCGDGLFLEMARDRGWVGSGIELNPRAAERAAARGFDIRVGKLEASASPDGEPFDLVTAWDSLEHTPEPAVFALHLSGLVRPGGRLMLTTLNRRSLVGLVFRQRWSMVIEDHFTYWNRQSLEHVIREAGFCLETMRSAGLGRDFVAWVDRLRALRTPGDAPERPKTGTWDSGSGLLRVEGALNAALDASSLGVELEVVASKAP